MDYAEFLERKAQLSSEDGFVSPGLPSFLFDFQSHLVHWALRRGRAAIFADCGLGKTPMQLVWADQVARHTKGNVLILTPLAVAGQTVAEGSKFGIAATRLSDGASVARISVTNYEKIHLFNPSDFAGVVCDESSILKNFDGARRQAITDFMRKTRYRLLCSATPAPNEYTELGTSSEALGHLGHADMLTRFFKNDQQNSIKPHRIALRPQRDDARILAGGGWRFKGHAEAPFWRWVSSWARAMRKPSDFGFDDAKFILPKLIEREHQVSARRIADGFLLSLPAQGLREQREERRRTIEERCEKAAALASHDRPVVVWCHLNDEGDLLEKLVPGCVQVSGNDSDDEKEEKFFAFISGQARALITKGKIGAWGLNLQHCAHSVSFPTHSYEEYHQSIRRFWRFGQSEVVVSDIVTTEGERDVLANLQRKSKAADRMFAALVGHMQDALHLKRTQDFNQAGEPPPWM